MSEKYKYDAPPPGGGVIGLPNEVTRAEAKALGVEHILNAAIANGLYKKIGGAKPKPKVKSAVKPVKGE